MTYLLLFLEFFKAGLFAIGGGLATLPFLYDMAATYPWFDEAILSDMIAISESTPGPIGVNMATYAGFNACLAEYGIVGAILGAVVATSALVLPSIIVIIIVAKFLEKFKEAKLVKQGFYGLRPAVCAMIAAAGWQVLQISIFNAEAYAATQNILDFFDWKAIILFAILLVLTNIKKLKLHPIVYIAASAVVGIVLQF